MQKKKVEIKYTEDGRKIIDGKIVETLQPDELWFSTITRSVAHDMKGKCGANHSSANSLAAYWEKFGVNKYFDLTPRRYMLTGVIFLFVIFLLCCLRRSNYQVDKEVSFCNRPEREIGNFLPQMWCLDKH
ncbi:hypothetical protein AB6A40_001163 [Gnathostoma spinigerum]|uniref:Uncharacterized protein n=1 Tax=Gnathostoma spinigerum TaxID=75299 RepID=A0ABD6E8G2_9BILA